MKQYVSRRLDPDERAGLRLTLLALGLVLVTVIVLPLGVLVREKWAPLNRLDTWLEGRAYDATAASGLLEGATKLLTHLGAPLLLQVVAALFAVWLIRHGHRRSAGYLATCVLGAYALSTLGKITVDRARPVFDEPLSIARGASFPSGHATGSAAFYLAVAVVLLAFVRAERRKWLLAMAIVVPLVVAATRVLLGVHYLTDVTAGLLLGWGWVAACTALFAAWRADAGRPVDVLEEGIDP